MQIFESPSQDQRAHYFFYDQFSGLIKVVLPVVDLNNPFDFALVFQKLQLLPPVIPNAFSLIRLSQPFYGIPHKGFEHLVYIIFFALILRAYF